MNCKLAFFGAATLLLLGNLARADYVPNNFWPNPAFETGANLDQPTGTPTNWSRTGSDTNICQVSTNNAVSSTHALAVVDDDGSGYGEWDSDLISLSGHANPGDVVTLQWYELYNVVGGEMRLTIGFFGANGALITETHFVTTGSSAGWQGTVDASTFTMRTQNLAVPAGAVKMRAALVSGGSEATTGVMVIDDLSVRPPATPVALAGNFWSNSAFETGSNLDLATGSPTGWTRSGSKTNICQVSTNNYVSSGHALAVIDTTAADYGEWDSDLVSLSGRANPGDVVTVQWFELYSITNGEMRVTIGFYGAAGAFVAETHFVTTGQSPGWQGTLARSGFTKRTQQLVVPPGAATMRVALVSGGSAATTGLMLIDDVSAAPPPPPPLLAGNFWPNPTFEAGSNLNLVKGTPTNWVRAGSDTNICQVSTNNYSSSSHSLALVDGDTNGYGEWDADVSLAGNVSPGDALDLQWFELYNVTNGVMRLTALFLNSTNGVVGQSDFVVTGASAGWQGAVAGSVFGVEKQQLLVPAHAVKLRLSLVSGGDATADGVMLIDDLSVARHAFPATVQSFNLFPNPTFEDGAQLDNATLALPAGGWQRGGSDASIDQALTNNAVSPSHSLALVDNNDSGYGEWYMFLNLPGFATNAGVVDIQWFEIYNTTNGGMRLSFAFLDAANNTLASQDFNVTDASPGWTGSVDTSPFETRFERLAVPAGVVQMRVNFASGGSVNVTGVMVIDDLSMRLSQPLFSQITTGSDGVNLTWYSLPAATYTVQSTDNLSAATIWTPLTTGLGSGGLTTSYLDTAAHPGAKTFYRVLQE